MNGYIISYINLLVIYPEVCIVQGNLRIRIVHILHIGVVFILGV